MNGTSVLLFDWLIADFFSFDVRMLNLNIDQLFSADIRCVAFPKFIIQEKNMEFFAHLWYPKLFKYYS